MPKYVIERTIPGVGQLDAEQRRDIARTSCGVLADMGAGIQWQHSYFTDDRVFCVYLASDEERIREHARRGGFPIDAIRRVSAVVDPVCAE
ncbi:DUF4242 domain-containing protein [Arenimonas fontis]|uniref:DUF4242 domain-containing protein n=1 Tax=Arenimonas fontis TaxID=2608255 RepID=A0A5B2ZAC5_9GAMM|nr:DUF4242 domain-containing protein [Arenimonas fontis]KAA2285096.1 DUF4242 domain-containing protein [Arenimonas fontis]